MKSFAYALSLAALPALCLAGGGPVPPAADEAVPRRLEARVEGEPPAWVAAADAAAAGGGVDWELLGARARRAYDGIVDGAPVAVLQADGTWSAGGPRFDDDVSGVRPDCVYYGPSRVDFHGEPPGGTVEQLIAHAPAVFTGEVTAVAQGFYLDEPYSLLAVRVEEWLREDPAIEPRRTMLVPYPRARFAVGGTTFCKGDPDFPPAPRAGARVLAFVYQPPADRGGMLLHKQPHHLLFLGKEGLGMSSLLRRRSRPDLLDFHLIRRRVAAGGGEAGR
jgi:hypothetical protein